MEITLFKYYLLLFSFCGLLFSSCAKEIELSVDNFSPKLVVNSLFEEGKNWEVEVSRSRNAILESSSPAVLEAEVIIKDQESGQQIILEYAGDKTYRSTTHSPVAGRTYFLEVHANGYNSIYSKGSVPEKTEVNLLLAEKLNYQGKEALRIDFEILDNKVEDNYYIYEILNAYPESISSVEPEKFITSPIKTWLSSLDGNTGYIVNGSNKQSKLFISDNLFKGAVINTSLVSYVELDDSVPNHKNVSKPKINLNSSRLKVISASKEMYEYYKYIELVIQKNTINSSVTTPIKPYGNITGGYGIFAGYSSILIDL